MEEKQKQNSETNQPKNIEGDIVIKPVNAEPQAQPVDTANTAPQVINKEPVVEQKVPVVEQAVVDQVPVVEQKNKDKELPVNKNAAESDKRPFIAGNWIKLVVFLLISISLILGNFFIEQYITEASEEEGRVFTAFDYKKDNILPEMGVFRFADQELAEEPPDIDVLMNKDGEYIFELKSGRVWGNLRMTNAKANILVDNILIIPSYASFDLDFDGSHMDLSVYNGDVYLAFLKDSVGIDEYVSPYSDYFVDDTNVSGSLNEYSINSLVVPQNMEVSIALKKVNDEIGPLLRSKLVKELKYAKLPDLAEKLSSDNLSDEEVRMYAWIKDNLDADNVYINSQEKNINSELSSYDKVSTSNFVSNFIFWAEENLLFVPEKKREMVFEHAFLYLNNAVYYLLNDDELSYEDNIQGFKSYLTVLSDDFVNSEEYYSSIDAYFNDFKFFDVADDEYKFLEFLLDQNLLQGRNIVESMSLLWSGVYFALNNNDYDAETAFDNYYEVFDDFLINYSEEYFNDIFVKNHNDLLSNLFLHYPVFYKKDYFDIKQVYENNILNISSNKEDLKQDYVSEKITFLKHLRLYFFEDLIEVEVAKEIYLLLLKQIESLMFDSSSLAVTEFFESELADMNDFYAYLTSQEYHSSSYGATHEERYNAYLDGRTTFLRWVDIQSELSGEEEVEEVSVDDVITEIEEIFESTEDLKKLIIGEIEDSTSRYVFVEFVLGGYPLEANYDRSLDLLTEVYVYDEIITAGSVKLDSLLGLLQDKFTEGVDIPEGEEEITIESIAEKTAKEYIADEIVQYGFVIDIEDISVVEELNAIYRVENTYLEGFEDKRVMFDILMASDALVTDVLMIVDGDPVMLEGKYSLEELAALVASETDF